MSRHCTGESKTERMTVKYRWPRPKPISLDTDGQQGQRRGKTIESNIQAKNRTFISSKMIHITCRAELPKQAD